ncbi:hypothetical protein TDB9533_00568 [Thalassocella blandensis]|nr:hypothetical protein TDB9533_00568 [Thalassocella blandensis]
MREIATTTLSRNISEDTLGFYQEILQVLNAASVPYLVGGTFALHHYAGIERPTKDLDLFIHWNDYDDIQEALQNAGFNVELTYPHWLAKVYQEDDFVDLIFSSGNGVAVVDDLWFEHAKPAELFGIATRLCPIEETIWSKAFIMERERFDGADIAHLILAGGKMLNWDRLLTRFDEHWRPLLSHLILFGFIYPAHRDIVPTWVMGKLLSRLNNEVYTPASDNNLCGGTLLSREQYVEDIHKHHYEDARVAPHGNLSQYEAERWTEASKGN